MQGRSAWRFFGSRIVARNVGSYVEVHASKHFEDNIKRRGVTLRQVLEAIRSPSSTRPGHRRDRVIARKKFRKTKILDVVYSDRGMQAVLISAWWYRS